MIINVAKISGQSIDQLLSRRLRVYFPLEQLVNKLVQVLAVINAGDAVFDDGNEWNIPISSITVDDTSGLVQLNTAILLSDDIYELTIYPDVSLFDEAGNPVVLNLSTDWSTPLDETQPIVLTFTVDTEGPPAPDAPQLDSDSDSGVDNSDNITNIFMLFINHPVLFRSFSSLSYNISKLSSFKFSRYKS